MKTEGKQTMTQINPVAFGRLQGEVELIQETLKSHTEILEKIDTKFEGSVSRPDFVEHVEEAQSAVARLDGRVSKLEEKNKITEASIWWKTSRSLESNVIKAVSIAIFSILLYVLVYVASNDGQLPITVFHQAVNAPTNTVNSK